MAEFILQPATQSVITLKHLTEQRWDVSPYALADELQKLLQPLHNENHHNAEDVLMAQSYVLDALFNTLCREAFATKQQRNRFQYLGTALKAQKQFRNTIETLHVMQKNNNKRTIKE